MSHSFDEILIAWVASNGGRIPTNSEDRKTCLRDLFVTLEDYGFLDDIKLKANQGRIINKCVNVGHNDNKKLAKWKSVVDGDLQVIIHEKFNEIKIRKANDSDFQIKTPEHKEYTPPPTLETKYSEPKPVKYFKPSTVDDPDWQPVNSVIDEDFLKKVGCFDE